MKRALLLGLIASGVALAASTFTTYYDLEKPADGDTGWGNSYRANMDTIDSQMHITAVGLADHIASSTAHTASSITASPGADQCTSATNVQDFLDCLDAAASGTGFVSVANDQTITGQKTFTQAIIASGGINSISTAELSYLDGASANIQTQLNSVSGGSAAQIAALQGATAAHTIQIAALQGATAAHTIEIAALQGATTSLQSQITALQGGTSFVRIAGDTMTGNLRNTSTSSSATHNSNSFAADGGISAAADIFAGRNGARGALRLKCDTGSECWRLSVGGAGGDIAFQLRSVLGNIVTLEVSTAGAATFASSVSAIGGTMTGLLGVGTLAYIGSTSGDIKFRAPAVAGSQSYQWPSSQQPSNSYLVGISTGVMLWEPQPNSEVFVQAATAYGSTATKVRRWTNLLTSTGLAITFDQSTISGDTFTINESGTYAMTYCDQFNAVANMGISIDASGTTSVQSLTNTNVVCGNNTPGAELGTCCSATRALLAGHVLRAHTDGTANGSNTWLQSFRIRKIGP